VSGALGEGPKTPGKVFIECCTRHRPLGKRILDVKPQALGNCFLSAIFYTWRTFLKNIKNIFEKDKKHSTKCCRHSVMICKVYSKNQGRGSLLAPSPETGHRNVCVGSREEEENGVPHRRSKGPVVEGSSRPRTTGGSSSRTTASRSEGARGRVPLEGA
jgi:hypothetical protein